MTTTMAHPQVLERSELATRQAGELVVEDRAKKGKS